MVHTSQNTQQQQVRHVLLTTLGLNLLVAVSKILLGFATGALAITADGFHSLTDGAGNIAGLIGIHYAARPADDNHPYGHQRFETLAALLIGGLLLLTAWEMVQGVFDRLQQAIPPTLSPLVFIVLTITLLINIAVSQYQTQAGKRLNSTILLADAANTSADVFVTLAVITSSAIVALTGWAWVDIVAAIVVVVLIGRAAWDILKQTGLVLVDTAPYEAQELHDLMATVQADVVRARSRGTRDAAHLDIDVHVPPEMTTDHTNSIAYAIRKQLNEQLDGLEAIDIQFIPHHPHGRDPVLTARAYADALGIATHEVQVSQDTRGCILEMHVEVAPQQTLAEAHAIVSALEADVAAALPDIDRVVTHIEPMQSTIITKDDMDTVESVQKQIMALLNAHYADAGWHDDIVHALPHGMALSIHATLPANITVEAAHAFAESAEALLRTQVPDLQRVTIHTEPFDHE
ncbi:MAG: cation diffusion facilitator family transporter [Phototrophicaceae bacterium]